jgi:hypothetical protein
MTHRIIKPKAFTWTIDQLNQLRTPEPYDICGIGALFELDAPDNSTVFLLLMDHYNEDAGHADLYAIEAPQECPMRKAFEWGELTWEEFWTHKDHLLLISVPLGYGIVHTRIVRPSEMSPQMKFRLKRLENLYPYELKRRQLEIDMELSRSHSAYTAKDAVTAEREDREFMSRVGHRLSKPAA